MTTIRKVIAEMHKQSIQGSYKLSILEDMESRGIHLNDWQLVELTGLNRRVGKTFLSYVMVMVSHHDGMIVTPYGDPDVSTASYNRTKYWLDGFISFILEYYPEYDPKLNMAKQQVTLTLKDTKSRDMSLIEKGLEMLKGAK